MATPITVYSSNEISLKSLVAVVWHEKWLIVVITVGFTVATGATAWSLPKTYTATVLMSPVTSSNTSAQLGALGTQLGGLASLAGVSLGGDQKKSESLAVLQSDAITEQYIQSHNLLPILYSKNWNEEKHAWTIADQTKIPTLWKANQYFKNKIRSVATDAKTGLVSLSITWTNPQLAAQWANDLARITNESLRDQAIVESERNIAFLNEQASKTDQVGPRQAIFTLLQTEINKVMLARGSESYALKILDPAQAPEQASFPRRLNWLIAGFAAGLFASILALIARANWRRDDARS